MESLSSMFDRREGWAGPGLLSCAHWLSWRIGLSPGAAREQVRVARRLEELPLVAAAFADGRVSSSKVRAISRAAEPGDGVDRVDLARRSSAAQLEQVARGVRRARSAEAAEVDPEAAAWTLRTRTRYDDNGNVTLTISGPAEFLPELQAGIEAKKVELQRERERDAQADGVPAQTPTVAAGRPADVPAGTPRPDETDLAGQAPGWPAGTTRQGVVTHGARPGTARWCTRTATCRASRRVTGWASGGPGRAARSSWTGVTPGCRSAPSVSRRLSEALGT